jgi:hypothetical protein
VGYQDTWLWKRAFIDERDDATPREQIYFAERYTAMREKCAALVARIATDMGHMTVHDVTHLDALWEMASIVTEGSFDINPPEAFVFGGAILIHDAAMTVAAYPNGIKDLRSTTEWRDAWARLSAESLDNVDKKDLDDLATAEALRRLHALQARNLPIQAWYGSSNIPEFLIDDPEVRNFYGPKIGVLANSHWWNIGRVEEEFTIDLGPLGGRTSNRIGMLKLACLLRVADAMHIDRRRAPPFLRKLLNPNGVSALHWTFQERMAVPYVSDGALVYSAAPAFGLEVAEAWWLAFDTLHMIDGELQQVDHLLESRNDRRLNAHRVKGINSSGAMSRLVETDGWDPVDARVRISDVPKIVKTLGGEKLYGDEPRVALRELLQNSADAIRARRRLENRPTNWGTITVGVESRVDGFWLTVEDNGIGMSSAVLTGPLIDFGNSFWRSSLAAEEFPGLQAQGITATGRYGIGFFAVFMLGDKVRLISRRFDRGLDSARVLEFRDGLGSRPILYLANSDQVPLDGGTRVEVLLRADPVDGDGLFWDVGHLDDGWDLATLSAHLAPALDVNVEVKQGNDTSVVVQANDWESIEQENLFSRLRGTAAKFRRRVRSADQLRPLFGPTGQMVGRAAISFGYSSGGCIVVGGLRASDLESINGVLVGRETTVARDEAEAIVSVQELARWATEQASLLGDLPATPHLKAKAAKVVLNCGGDIGELPFARWNRSWVARSDLRALLAKRHSIYVFMNDEVSYDQDSDDVHPREFGEFFEDSKTTLFIPDFDLYEYPGPDSGLPYDGRTDFEDVLIDVIAEEWGEYRAEKVYHSVGKVLGTSIDRRVTKFSRVRGHRK